MMCPDMFTDGTDGKKGGVPPLSMSSSNQFAYEL